jgi:hypothetical protein
VQAQHARNRRGFHIEAGKHLGAGSNATCVVADTSVENVNEQVNAWFDVGQLRRLLAQVEVSFSSSMI